MILQTCYSVKNPNPSVSLSSTLSHSCPIQFKAQSLRPRKRLFLVGVRCSVSKVHNYGTVDYERRPPLKWNVIYKRLSLTEDSGIGSASELDLWETDGKQLTKWELCRVVKELRKYNRYSRALEVYEWMENKRERFRLSSSDAAIQLDLIGKVRGISEAENFFLSLTETLRDMRVYGAMLNSYVRAKRKEKAEALLDQIRAKGYATQSLPFNVMMTLYRNINEYDEVEVIVSEMIEKNIQLDVYSYNIWLSCRGTQATPESMEEVYEKMRLDKLINPNWTTFTTMATMYIKMGLFDKAEESLRRVESRITGRDRIPYHYLLSLYGGIGKKDEVYRVWNVYKSVFRTIPNMGYHAIISSLIRMGDIEGAEKIYKGWLQVKASYDPRIANLFIGFYVTNGNVEKAVGFIDHIAKVGGKPNAGTWEALAEGHIKERNVSEALFCWEKASVAEGSNYWKPRLTNVTAFLSLCDEEADLDSKEILVRMLKEAGHWQDESDTPLIGSDENGITSTGDISDSALLLVD